MSTNTNSDENSIRESRVGYDVPWDVRRGGATQPRHDRDGDGTFLAGHAVTFACPDCGNERRYVTSRFTAFDYCPECDEWQDYRFEWDLNR